MPSQNSSTKQQKNNTNQQQNSYIEKITKSLNLEIKQQKSLENEIIRLKALREKQRIMNNMEKSDSQSQESTSQKTFSSQKERILYQKQQTKNKELQKRKRELEQARKENIQGIKQALEIQEKQLRPSTQMRELFGVQHKKKQFNIPQDAYEEALQIEEDDNLKYGSPKSQYPHDNDDFVIDEEEYKEGDESQYTEESIDQQILRAENELTNKQKRINDLSQVIQNQVIQMKSNKIMQNSFNQEMMIDEDFAEEVDQSLLTQSEITSEDSQIYAHPQLQMLQERIQLLKHRCEAGLGNRLFQKVYKYLSRDAQKLQRNKIRKHLIQIIGKNNIGFWHLIDQIMLFEEMIEEKLTDLKTMGY